MAYFKCNECGYLFSDSVASCPNCGCPVDQRTVSPPDRNVNNVGANNYAKAKSSNTWLYVVIGILAAAVVAVGILLINRLSGSAKEGSESMVAHEDVAGKSEAALAANELDLKDNQEQRQQAKEQIKRKEEVAKKAENTKKQTYTMFPSNLEFNGKINGSKADYYFSMNLSIRDDGNVNGYYVVLNGKQEQVKLTGTYNANSNSIKLYEHNAVTGRSTGYSFDASLFSSYSGYSLSGRYKCNKPKIDWYFSADTN